MHKRRVLLVVFLSASGSATCAELDVGKRLTEVMFNGEDRYPIPGTAVQCGRNGVLYDPRLTYRHGATPEQVQPRCSLRFDKVRLIPLGDAKVSGRRSGTPPQWVEDTTLRYDRCATTIPFTPNDSYTITETESVSVRNTTTLTAGSRSSWAQNLQLPINLPGLPLNLTFSQNGETQHTRVNGIEEGKSDTVQRQQYHGISGITIPPGTIHLIKLTHYVSQGYFDFSATVLADGDVTVELVAANGTPLPPITLGKLSVLIPEEGRRTVELSGQIWNARMEDLVVKGTDIPCSSPTGTSYK